MSAPWTAGDLSAAWRPTWDGPSPDRVTSISAMIGNNGPTKTFRGRAAWALAHLLAAGGSGITTIERPAPRWSHYIWLLRRAGLIIDRQDEYHGGAFSGHHGRFRLKTPVFPINIESAGETA